MDHLKTEDAIHTHFNSIANKRFGAAGVNFHVIIKAFLFPVISFSEDSFLLSTEESALYT